MKVQIGEKVIEVPEGVEVKIIESKKPKFRVGDYVSHYGGVFRITSIWGEQYNVVEIKPSKGTPENWETTGIGFCEEDKMMLLPDYEEIMDEFNGHDKRLVEKINDAWNKGRERFAIILRALYARDIGEITDHDAFQCEEWVETEEYEKGCNTHDWSDYMTMVLGLMQENWTAYADNYLMHIADDKDLECILDFIGYPWLDCYND